MCRHCITEIFLLLGCVGLACRHAALRTKEDFLTLLGRKALNLCLGQSGRPSAFWAVAIPSLSARAAEGMPRPLLPLLRQLLLQHLSLFLLTRSQA